MLWKAGGIAIAALQVAQATSVVLLFPIFYSFLSVLCFPLDLHFVTDGYVFFAILLPQAGLAAE